MDGISFTSHPSVTAPESAQYPASLPKIASIKSAAFQTQYAARDLAAGLITGVMAIPLSVGIAMMSDYPIKVGLATVAFACLVGWINAGSGRATSSVAPESPQDWPPFWPSESRASGWRTWRS
jgi:hypothetical protein